MSLIQQIFAIPFSIRQRKVAKSRDPLSKCDFVARVVYADGDREAANLVHEKLKEWIYVNHFTSYPEDELGKIYGIAEEELDEDLILDILEKTGLQPPSREAVKMFGEVRTPIDVARLVKVARDAQSA